MYLSLFNQHYYWYQFFNMMNNSRINSLMQTSLHTCLIVPLIKIPGSKVSVSKKCIFLTYGLIQTI